MTGARHPRRPRRPGARPPRRAAAEPAPEAPSGTTGAPGAAPPASAATSRPAPPPPAEAPGGASANGGASPSAPDDDIEGLPPPPPRRGLRQGYTTGATAAAAARAATLALLTGERQSQVTVELLEARRRPTFAVVRCDPAPGGGVTCAVIKDGGDDPDATHGAEIRATVTRTAEPGVSLRGGEGVGTVTRPGLGLPVGGPAINAVPRIQIRREVEAAARQAGRWDGSTGFRVEISVPRGAEIARRTLNPRLGILGGISILGTTGVVYPYSTAAYRASVEQGVDVAAANGAQAVVLSTGGKSEEFARHLLPDLPEVAFVEMGEFTGVALDRCRRAGIARAIQAGMIGKMSKIAQGHFQTHVAGNQVDTAFLADLAASCGAAPEVQEQVRAANTARHVQEIALAAGLTGLFPLICRLVCQRSRARVHDALAVECLLFDFDGVLLGRASLG